MTYVTDYNLSFDSNCRRYFGRGAKLQVLMNLRCTYAELI